VQLSFGKNKTGAHKEKFRPGLPMRILSVLSGG
jgi:hypothetical protein